MAVFLVNTCKFNGCGLTFSTLQDLIYHIEEVHLDFDARHIEETELKQTASLPVSYIFRVFSGDYPGAHHPHHLAHHPHHHLSGSNVSTNGHHHHHPLPVNGSAARNKDHTHKSKSLRTHSPVPSICSTTPTGSEMDEENYESESEKSGIDSWSNSIDSDNNNIVKMISTPGTIISNEDHEKPYICQVNNCRKRYRNSNGLKYHTKSVHTNNNGTINGNATPIVKQKEAGTPKTYKCPCNKVYKTPYGLKNHMKQCSAAGQQQQMIIANGTATMTPNGNNNNNNNNNSKNSNMTTTMITSTVMKTPTASEIDTSNSMCGMMTPVSLKEQSNDSMMMSTPDYNSSSSNQSCSNNGLISGKPMNGGQQQQHFTSLNVQSMNEQTNPAISSLMDHAFVPMKPNRISNGSNGIYSNKKANGEMTMTSTMHHIVTGTGSATLVNQRKDAAQCPMIKAPTLQQHLLNPIGGATPAKQSRI